MKYLIILEKTESGWSAYAPDLPGCVSAGDTRGETIDLMKESIKMHIEGMKEDGLEIPQPSVESEFISV